MHKPAADLIAPTSSKIELSPHYVPISSTRRNNLSHCRRRSMYMQEIVSAVTVSSEASDIQNLATARYA